MELRSGTPATDLLGPDIRVRILCLSGDITWRSTALDYAGDVLTVTGVSSANGREWPPDMADRLRRARLSAMDRPILTCAAHRRLLAAGALIRWVSATG
jgi:hypothetical protein